MTQVTVTLNEDEEKALLKRADKNMMTLEDQVQDIIRRSCVNYVSKPNKRKIKVDDRLVGIFSRYKTRPTKKSKK